MQALRDIEQAFWSNVWRCTHRTPCKKCCWPWNRRRTPEYGTATPKIAGKAIPAHRLAYILAHGALILPASAGVFVVTHRCDFPPCCNPAHLALGTTGDNLRDARRKGYYQYRRQQYAHLPDGTVVPVARSRTIPMQCRATWGAYLRDRRSGRCAISAAELEALFTPDFDDESALEPTAGELVAP
jgi:hypothetical protein